MDELNTIWIVFGSAFFVFVLTLPVLAGLNGACSGRCDASGEPQCDLCPQRHAADAADKGAP